MNVGKNRYTHILFFVHFKCVNKSYVRSFAHFDEISLTLLGLFLKGNNDRVMIMHVRKKAFEIDRL